MIIEREPQIRLPNTIDQSIEKTLIYCAEEILTSREYLETKGRFFTGLNLSIRSGIRYSRNRLELIQRNRANLETSDTISDEAKAKWLLHLSLWDKSQDPGGIKLLRIGRSLDFSWRLSVRGYDEHETQMIRIATDAMMAGEDLVISYYEGLIMNRNSI